MQHYVYKSKRFLIGFSNKWLCLQEAQNIPLIDILHLLFNIFLLKRMKEKVQSDKLQHA